jgi:ribitol-5-phosphate 2-dehydrogenase (NADP+) / D-ribitol-5-phosphate cytidylyltransferase
MNSSRRPVVAAVLAAGAGHRFGAGRPKQLLPLGDRTVLEWSVSAFVNSPDVDEVLVVVAAGLVGEVRGLLSRAGMAEVAVIEGGVLRTDSTRTAIEALGARDCDVLFHDGARPLVDARTIADCVAALQVGEAVTAAVPVTDTIAEVGPDGRVLAIPDRDGLRAVQTPQGFRLSTIRRAFELMAADPAAAGGASDDCRVVLTYLPDVTVTLVTGSPRNLKITHPSDLELAERLLQG